MNQPRTPVLRNGGFTLVELMIVVAIIGVLAAIAIPAFLRYVKSSKTSEAEAIMKKMSEGAKSYFVSEQRYSGSNGAEPWHPAGSGSATPGLPISFSAYVFPGGSATTINTAAAECTGGAPDTVGAPTRGQKIIPCLGVPAPAGTEHGAAMNKMRVTLADPLYFKYFYETTGTGLAATANVWAIADFVTGGPGHTVQQTLTISPTEEVLIGPAVLRYEFE